MLEDHLGGHCGVTHVDKGALRYFVNKFSAKSFLDIGCGPGKMVELAQAYGMESLGIDGDYTVSRFDPSKFVVHDFCDGPYITEQKYDIGWSCEFVEHVYEEFIPNYVEAFRACKAVMITYAPPGWPGHHHVNCQERQYWIDTLFDYGLSYEDTWTEELRESSTMNIYNPKKAFVRNRGLMFRNLEC